MFPDILATVRLLHLNYPLAMIVAEGLLVVGALALAGRVLRHDPTFTDRSEEDMDV